jgi:hypothetical protein
MPLDPGTKSLRVIQNCGNTAKLPPDHTYAQYVKVKKTEEKGSDVNLASHLLVDGFLGKYEVAVVLTNDSDLVAPIQLVRKELKLKVGVIFPSTERQSKELRRYASFNKTLQKHHLVSSQFPDVIIHGRSTIIKPKGW